MFHDGFGVSLLVEGGRSLIPLEFIREPTGICRNEYLAGLAQLLRFTSGYLFKNPFPVLTYTHTRACTQSSSQAGLHTCILLFILRLILR